MQYTLTGFTHDSDVRVFAFVCVSDDKQKTEFRVRADIRMIQRYGIRVQELPLLCRGLLERRTEGDAQRTFTYTEADMRHHAEFCAARDAAQSEKKRARKPPHKPVTGGWSDGRFSLGPGTQR